MSKHPLAIVCALAFLVGGASALLLEYPPRGDAGVGETAERGADLGSVTPAETGAGEGRPAEPARREGTAASKDGPDFSPPPDEPDAQPTQPGGEAEAAVNPSARVRGRASADARGGEGRRATRGYTRVQGRGEASGGQGIAGYTVSGVKKTGGGVKKAGAAIGKTFGKIGGVFHD